MTLFRNISRTVVQSGSICVTFSLIPLANFGAQIGNKIFHANIGVLPCEQRLDLEIGPSKDRVVLNDDDP